MAEKQAIIVKQSFSSSINDVWKAITEHDQMIQWFFDNIPDFKAEVGFYTEFNVSSGGRDFFHQWKIIEVIPYKKISYQWSYKGYEVLSYVHFELTEEEAGCKLKLTAEGGHKFPQDIPEFRRESGIAGWKYFIQGRLRDFLANKQ